jgi:hypothetical protein
MSKINVKYVYTFSFYLTDNNLRLHYNDYSVNAVKRNSRCFLAIIQNT